jgi:hypothetical protein
MVLLLNHVQYFERTMSDNSLCKREGKLRKTLLLRTCVSSAARGATTLALLTRAERLEAIEEIPARCAMMEAIVCIGCELERLRVRETVAKAWLKA